MTDERVRCVFLPPFVSASDGPWNRYEPEAYKRAFRRVVTRLRAGGVRNFISVWQCATSSLGTFGGRALADWWPGDEYVDWAGLSYFVPHASSMAALLRLARAKRKPVLICEAAPQGYDIARGTVASIFAAADRRAISPAETWQRWYAPFFAFVYENLDVIRGVAYVRLPRTQVCRLLLYARSIRPTDFCLSVWFLETSLLTFYFSSVQCELHQTAALCLSPLRQINANWDSQPMWGPPYANGYWGDTRVNANPEILERWNTELRRSPWIHADTPGLFH